MNTQSGSTPNNEIAFVDVGVAHSGSILSQFSSGTEIHLLDSSQDAIDQITQVLASRSNVSAVHVVSHGSDGALLLGETTVSDLSNYQAELKQWSNSLTTDADILLYGCNVAENATGKAFVNQLAQLTSADVTASDDLTGSAALGGDWMLEYQTGSIETSSIDATDYSSTLANFTVTTLTDIVNPNDGVISLREAVNAANTLGGSNNIFFGVNGTFTLGGSELTISSNLSIFGNGASLTTISGNNASRVFTVNSGTTVLLSGLTITNGQVPGPNQGGGIFNSGALTMQFCTLSGNSASYGGGIRNTGSLTINRSTISNNSVFQFGSGGGIRNSGNLTINRSTLSGNSASGGFGGGIDNEGGLTVTSSTFTGNSAIGGGGISNGGALIVTSSTFTGNSASGGGGIADFGTTTLIGNVVSQNRANTGGGVLKGGGTVKLQLNNISSNTAPSGPDLLGAFISGNSPTNPFGFNVIGKGGGFTGILNGINGDVILVP